MRLPTNVGTPNRWVNMVGLKQLEMLHNVVTTYVPPLQLRHGSFLSLWR